MAVIQGCASAASSGHSKQSQTVHVVDSQIVSSTNVVIQNVLKQGIIVVGKDLHTTDLADAVDLSVPISELVNPSAALPGNGDLVHIKIPKSSAASETIRLTTVQTVEVRNTRIENSSGVVIGNQNDSGGIQSTGMVITEISAQATLGGTNAAVTGLALPANNVLTNKTNALQQAGSTVLKASAVDPQSGAKTPAYIPIPNNLIHQ